MIAKNNYDKFSDEVYNLIQGHKYDVFLALSITRSLRAGLPPSKNHVPIIKKVCRKLYIRYDTNEIAKYINHKDGYKD